MLEHSQISSIRSPIFNHQSYLKMGREQSGLQVAPVSTPDYSLPQPEDRSSSLPELDKSAMHSNVSYYHNSINSPGLHPAYTMSEKEVAEPDRRHRICGMSPLFYSILVASITAIVVGVAVGVGVGTQLSQAMQQRTCSSSVPTVTQTVTATATIPFAAASTTQGGYYIDYTAVRPSLVASLQDACPIKGGQNFTASHGSIFSMNCAGGWNGGDLATIWAYSHEDCIDACEAINHRNATAKCTKVQWDRYMRNAAQWYGNCYLKSDNAQPQGPAPGQISAMLMG
jgi:hypothetical protein